MSKPKLTMQDLIETLAALEPKTDFVESYDRVFPLRNNPFDIGPDDDFYWVKKDGEQILPADMATMHLYYALRMLFNNSVPAAFRVGKFRRYSDVRDLPRPYFVRAIHELYDELSEREDMDQELSDAGDGTTIGEQLEDMLENAAVLCELGLGPILNDDELEVNGNQLLTESESD